MPGPYALSGSGVQTIASPAQLVVAVTLQPSLGRNGKANPPNLFDIALLTPGDPNGWYGAIPVSENPMVIPMPAGCTRLGYACLYGAQLSVAEVAAVPVTASLMPWDRNPTVWTQFAQPIANGGTSDTYPWTYTVPAGRKLMLAGATCQAVRQNIGSPGFIEGCDIQVNGTAIASAVSGQNVAGNQEIGAAGGVGLLLVAGSVIRAHYANGDTGGSILYTMAASGYTFDA